MENLRPLLTTYAYNILGSLEEAKDIVQDVFLKFLVVETDKVEDQKSYLIRMVINRSINVKRNQMKLTIAYPGEWLPEPIATERADDILNRREVLSYSLMVLLEQLDARQRAVFILKEAFNYEHAEIAEVLDITVEHSRKILSRAKKQLKVSETIHETHVHTDYLDKYLYIMQHGDTKQLEQLLNEDIILISDGGGKVTAAMKPVIGKSSVSDFLMGIYRKFYNQVRIEEGIVNHQRALFYYRDDKLVNCQIFSFTKGVINRFFMIRNPDKLRFLQKSV